MLSITIDLNDSPKFYAAFRDVNGNMLSIARDNIVELKYSVTKLVAGGRYPVENYTDVNIPITNWHETPGEYPSTIREIDSAQIPNGYNLEVFPYRNENGGWDSPFSEPYATYYLTVVVAYNMTDPALVGSALHRRYFTARIITGSM